MGIQTILNFFLTTKNAAINILIYLVPLALLFWGQIPKLGFKSKNIYVKTLQAIAGLLSQNNYSSLPFYQQYINDLFSHIPNSL